MERPKSPTVRHGMALCARRGCQKEECREAERRRRRENRHADQSEKVSSEEAKRHCEALREACMSVADIAARSGIADSQIFKLLSGNLPTVYRYTSEALLGVVIRTGDHALNVNALAEAIGSQRRLRALAVQGFSSTFLAEKGGILRPALRVIRSGEQTHLRISTLRIITALHDRFWDADPVESGASPNGVVFTKSNAEREKWWPTEAWSDIDDPDCKPTLETPRYVILAENYRELVGEQKYSVKDAAERIGVTANTLDKAVRYYEMRMAQSERKVS